MIESAVDALLARNGLRRADIRFWVAHPGGRKVLDNVQRHLGLTDEQLRFSRAVLRKFGNMSSPTVMFVLDEVMRTGDLQPADYSVKSDEPAFDKVFRKPLFEYLSENSS